MSKYQLIQWHLLTRNIFLNFFDLFFIEKTPFLVTFDNFICRLFMHIVNFNEKTFDFQAVLLNLIDLIRMMKILFINLLFMLILKINDLRFLLLNSSL